MLCRAVTMLVIVSVPFALLGFVRPRWRVLLVPYVVWAGFALLERVGWLPGESSDGAVLLAGTLGAVCAAVGVMLGRTRRLRRAGP